MEFEEEDFLQISGIQHFAFCKRQWAIIHIEQQWAENLRTTEGKLLHENAYVTRYYLIGLKYSGDNIAEYELMSPPARGAWIEMENAAKPDVDIKVAPRTGGVD